jgi:phospholipid/cholesterol/gamma-HCH transport system substrate-binding protein
MRNEVKLALFALAAMLLGFWGFRFLQGTNILNARKGYITSFQDIKDLKVSSPVFISGYQVGTVTEINLDENDPRKVWVEFSVKRGVNIPKTTFVVLYPINLTGGMALRLDYSKPCKGDDCAEAGTHFASTSESMLNSLLGKPDSLTPYVQKMQAGVNALSDTLFSPYNNTGLSRTARDLEASMAHIKALTANMNSMVVGNQVALSSVLKNLASVTQTLSSSQNQIKSMLTNFDQFSTGLGKVNMVNTTGKVDKTLDSATVAAHQLKMTLASTEKTISELQTTLSRINNGNGTIGKLASDETIYKNLLRTSTNMDLLLQDLRLNPKRYVHVSVFGKKQKTYTLPVNDPAEPILQARDTLR